MIYTPHNYQKVGEQHLFANRFAAWWAEMGLGKTVVTLSVINKLIYYELECSAVLIIAPKMVALKTWSTEKDKWDHLKHLTISKVIGTTAERVAALRVKADIYIINREQIAWLVTHYQTSFPFKTVVIDESSSFKDEASKRFKALKMVRPLIDRLIELTGTPASVLKSLWPQIYLLDQGKRLGDTSGKFNEAYISRVIVNGITVRSKVSEASEAEMYRRLSDICLSMKAEDYLDLPKRTDIIVDVDLSPEVFKQYKEFEKEQVLNFMQEGEITAVNAGVLCNKLLQFAGGSVYNKEREVINFHTAKMDALEELLEAAQRQPVLIIQNLQHERDRIIKAFGARQIKTEADIDAWNQGKILIGMLHPKSGGHGLNLQYGGHIMVWFGPIYSLEEYQQTCARLDRQGQTEPVRNYRIVAKRTIDEKVIAVTDQKDATQRKLMDAVKAIVNEYAAIL